MGKSEHITGEKEENGMNAVLEYVSNNGYKGILYGKGGYLVLDRAGNPVFETKERNINTYEELQDAVEYFPNVLKLMGRK